MGTTASNMDSFTFNEQKYTKMVKEQIKTNANNTNDDVLKTYVCLIDGHLETQIDYVCTNVICYAYCRMACKFCVRDEIHSRDKDFVMSQFRQDHEISNIFKSFKTLINMELDSIEFDILLHQLKLYYKYEQQHIYLQICCLEGLIKNLINNKLEINNIDHQDYYEKLRLRRNLGLLEYFYEYSIHIDRLKGEYLRIIQHNQQHLSSVESVIDQEEYNCKKRKQQQILLDLHKSNIQFYLDQLFQNKCVDKKVQSFIDKEVDNIIQLAYIDVQNKNINNYQQLRDEFFFMIDLSAKQYKAILEIQIKQHFDQNNKFVAYDFIALIISQLPMKTSLSLKTQQFKGTWTFEQAKLILDKVMYYLPKKSFYKLRGTFLFQQKLNQWQNMVILKKHLIFMKNLKKLSHIQSFYKYKVIKNNNLVNFLEKYNKLDLALMAYDKAIKLYPRNKYFYLQKGYENIIFIAEFLEKHNFLNEALTTYNQAFKLYPKDKLLLFKKGCNISMIVKFLEKNKKIDEALMVIDQLIELGPIDIFTYLKVKQLKNQNKLEEALMVYDQATKQYPNIDIEKGSFIYMQLVMFLEEQNKINEAAMVFNQAIELHPQDITIYFRKVEFLRKHNQIKEASMVYDQVIKLNPQDKSIYYEKVKFLEKHNKIDEALQVFNQVIEIDPLDKRTYFEKVKFLCNHNKIYEASMVYDQVIKLSPKDKSIYFQKSYYYIYMIVKFLENHNKIEEAIPVYDQAIEQDPQDKRVYFEKVKFLQNHNKIDEALMVYDQVIKLNPQDPTSYQEKGYQCIYMIVKFLENHNKLEEAILAIDQAIKLDPKNKTLYLRKAEIQGKCNKLDEALIVYDKAIDIDSNNESIYYEKAKFLEKHNKIDEALMVYDNALIQHPNSKLLIFKKADFLQEYNKKDKAQIFYDYAKQLLTQHELNTLFQVGFLDNSDDMENEYIDPFMRSENLLDQAFCDYSSRSRFKRLLLLNNLEGYSQ